MFASRRGRSRACRFIEWSTRHGPFDTIIDGANVGMFNQNFEDAKFNFNQVERLLAHLRAERGEDSKPVLLVLHQRRVRGGPAGAPHAVKLIKQWRDNSAQAALLAFGKVVRGADALERSPLHCTADELFTTPAGSNDDWYWLYAAVVAGTNGFLVTNDELRDHVFQMLPAPRLFYKWKERHQVWIPAAASVALIRSLMRLGTMRQVRFQFNSGGVVLHRPSAFTTCIQEAADGRWWMFPSSETEEWLCAQRMPDNGAA